MQMESEVLVHGIKESSGTFEGRPFSSTVFHLEVDMKENGAGRALGHVTREFKLPDHGEFEKWAHLGAVLNAGPMRAKGMFEIEAVKDGTRMVLVSIRPLAATTSAAPAAVKQPA